METEVPNIIDVCMKLTQIGYGYMYRYEMKTEIYKFPQNHFMQLLLCVYLPPSYLIYCALFGLRVILETRGQLSFLYSYRFRINKSIFHMALILTSGIPCIKDTTRGMHAKNLG